MIILVLFVNILNSFIIIILNHFWKQWHTIFVMTRVNHVNMELGPVEDWNWAPSGLHSMFVFGVMTVGAYKTHRNQSELYKANAIFIPKLIFIIRKPRNLLLWFFHFRHLPFLLSPLFHYLHFSIFLLNFFFSNFLFPK